MLLMNYAFGEDWRSLFDIVVVHAQKGDFFEKEAKFKGKRLCVRVGGLFGFGTLTTL